METRITHVAATARLISEHGDLDPDFELAVRGIGETLTGLAEQMQVLTHPND